MFDKKKKKMFVIFKNIIIKVINYNYLLNKNYNLTIW